MNKKIENKLIKQAGVQYVAKRKDVKKYADSEVYNSAMFQRRVLTLLGRKSSMNVNASKKPNKIALVLSEIRFLLEKVNQIKNIRLTPRYWLCVTHHET